MTVTFDDMFAVLDLKVIEGKKGLFVAMPTVKMKDSCPKCHREIPMRSKYCSECGAKIEQEEEVHHDGDEEGLKEHKDIAHPVTAEAREYIRTKVVEAFEAEKNSS